MQTGRQHQPTDTADVEDLNIEQMMQQNKKDVRPANAARALLLLLLLLYKSCNWRLKRLCPYSDHALTLSRRHRNKSNQCIDMRRFVYRRMFLSRCLCSLSASRYILVVVRAQMHNFDRALILTLTLSHINLDSHTATLSFNFLNAWNTALLLLPHSQPSVLTAVQSAAQKRR